jgi:SAM-dependent methyltransferase
LVTGTAQPLREQRLVFGEVAHLYDRQRPSYPARVVEAILDFAGLDTDDTTPVAEVGAGTGKASVLFAARGLDLTCLEPSSAMAAMARRNLAQFPNAKVRETSFEDWQPTANSYGLVLAAQSWHWIAPEARYVQAERALKAGGTLALFWNVMLHRGDERLQLELNAAYGEFSQDRWAMAQTERAEVNSWVEQEIRACGLFVPSSPFVVREPWQRSYDTEAWIELLSTQSDHRMLEEDSRAALFDKVRAAVEANGGKVDVGYLTVAYLARTLGRQGP